MKIIGLIVGVIVLYALIQALRTRMDFNDPVFEMKVQKKVFQYAAKHGVEPPGHMMPRIYKEVREEMKNQK